MIFVADYTYSVMVFGERVAHSVVASIVGAILASQYCASQMTGNFILHAVSFIVAHVHVYYAEDDCMSQSFQVYTVNRYTTRLAGIMKYCCMLQDKKELGYKHAYLITITHRGEHNSHPLHNLARRATYVLHAKQQ